MKASLVRFVFLFAFILVVVGCSSSINFTRFTDVVFRPTAHVDFYSTKMPTRDYIEIGRLVIEVDSFSGEDALFAEVLKKAKALGAEGLILAKEGSSGAIAVPIAGFLIAGEMKTQTYIAIRYKQEI